MGPAGGIPVPGGGRSARRVAGRVAARGEGVEADRRSVVAAIARHQGLSGQQSHPVSLVRYHAESGDAGPAGGGRSCASRNCRRCCSRMGPCCAIRSRVRSRSGSAGRSRPPWSCTTWRLSAPGRPGSRPRSTAPPRGCARCCSIATRPGGQAGSSSRIENYLGFPNGLSGSDLTRRALAQAAAARRGVPRAARSDGAYRSTKATSGSR